MSLPVNRVLLGDCRQVMSTLPSASVDFILTDPPYLVNYCDRENRSIQGDIDAGWLKPAFAQMFRVLKQDSFCVSFYGWSKTDLFFEAWKAAGFRIVGHITFPKRYTSTTRMMRYQHEGAYLLCKGNPQQPEHLIGDVVEFAYSGNKLHPTQKPLSALAPLIESFCPPRGVVLDPLGGSGSTCVAARSVGRDFIAIEIDPLHHEVSSRRVRTYADRLAAIAANDSYPVAA